MTISRRISTWTGSRSVFVQVLDPCRSICDHQSIWDCLKHHQWHTQWLSSNPPLLDCCCHRPSLDRHRVDCPWQRWLSWQDGRPRGDRQSRRDRNGPEIWTMIMCGNIRQSGLWVDLRQLKRLKETAHCTVVKQRNYVILPFLHGKYWFLVSFLPAKCRQSHTFWIRI